MLFGFRKFIAPTVIKFLYYISVVFTILGGIGIIIYALAEMKNVGGAESMKMIGAALIGTPLALAVLRFTTELWLVMFEINDRLGDIRDNTTR